MKRMLIFEMPDDFVFPKHMYRNSELCSECPLQYVTTENVWCLASGKQESDNPKCPYYGGIEQAELIK